MTTARSISRRFFNAQAGVSAIEFSLVMPIMILIMIAGIQIVTYVNAMRRVEMVAASISEMISQAVPPGNSTTASVNYIDLHFAYDSTLVVFPYVMKDAARKNIQWWQDLTIDFAGIQFASNGKTCPAGADQSPCYTANVGWSSLGTVGSNHRLCGIPLLPVDNSATPTKTTLPRGLYGAGSIIAVDVVFNFVPTFGAKFLPSVNIVRSVFVQPRYATFIDYSTTNSDGIASLCPGYT